MKSGKSNPILILLLVFVILGALVATIMVFKMNKTSGLDSFPSSSFLETPQNFVGNRYLLEGQIETQLAWEASKGRLISVIPVDSSSRVPVLIATNVNENIHPKQRYRMQVVIKEGGLVYANTIEKY